MPPLCSSAKAHFGSLLSPALPLLPHTPLSFLAAPSTLLLLLYRQRIKNHFPFRSGVRTAQGSSDAGVDAATCWLFLPENRKHEVSIYISGKRFVGISIALAYLEIQTLSYSLQS